MLYQMTWHPQSPDLNPTEMAWDELDHRVKEKQPTSALHMFFFFQKIVYRQIISLIIHCITIPVGQRFTYTKLTKPLNSLEYSRK